MSQIVSILLGTLIGLSLGAIGGGGSILTVPILVYIIGQDVHTATATSLAIVGTTAMVGAIPHRRAGSVSFATALPFGVAGIGGAFVGTWLNHLLPGRLILGLFGGLMLVVAVRMVVAKRNAATTQAQDAAPKSWRSWARVIVVGAVVGVMTGFFGVGGGFLIVPALVLVLHVSMRKAVGTSLVIIAINSAAGLLAHVQYGGLDLATTGLFIVGGAAGALVGARLSGRVDERALQRGFGAFVAVLGLWLMISNFWLLLHS